MPFKSEAQRRYIYMQAQHGEKWAQDFIKHSGYHPPKPKKKKTTGKRKKGPARRGKGKRR